ncbi:SDR family NAD(P)-dependent oxidoreductase [Autumnicola musiva]|uniref:3-oxoacyl-ACP reductase family protein n=1 Tax=Autumnicola musiva TaxID=3075589 RepID=A0ABU3D617_9FLAO|nr:3-oxoacyl-ACP reductase family protein [Zunongwangia sp. F117]MDT0676978.1 3-oxoacyl-ACP reductase family protein [Zunongwangia sp. F117]
MENLKNKIALITGGSRGIGRSIALALGKEGSHVAVNYQHSEDKAEEVCEMIKENGGKAIAVQADVSEEREVKKMINRVRNELGEIEILINNAGIAKKQKVEDVSLQDFDKAIKVNLRSGFLVTQEVLPAMRRKKWGRILMISSVAAQTGGVVGVDYATSKAGQLGMMRYYAKNLAEENITANAIAPALIDTDMVEGLGGVKPEIIPVKRFGKPEEVASLSISILKNGYITGQTFNINGGMQPS